jgi:hypothetical protein
MLEDLCAVLAELPSLVREDGWHGLHVTYHPPVVERLWRQHGAHRLFLHRIHPCDAGEALWHPHPWPSAVAVVSGRYEMGLAATSPSRYSIESGVYVPERGPELATTILTAGSQYEMLTPQAWHSVRPLEAPSLSVMLVGEPWRDAWPTSNFPKPSEPQGPLPDDLRAALLADFQQRFS